MSERTVLVKQDTFAIFDDAARTVYFEKLLSESKRVRSRNPGEYKIPDGYTAIEPPAIWPAQPSSWVI